ncbi:MAG TPA: hypothetical protein VHE60_17365 [Pyrinomonadaceae bacterium]|nr:hypothetical protein [Pyrinomonadaceae bacterium]
MPPSAKATADIETTRRQVAKNRVRFFIFRFSFLMLATAGSSDPEVAELC